MNSKPNLLIVNKFHEETIEKLDKYYSTHHLWSLDKSAKQDLLDRLNGHCSAAATASWACDSAVYNLQGLELIACFGVGVDGIDFEKAAERDIKVTNTPDVLNEAVADLALSMILAITRNLINADHHVRSNNWLRQGPLGFGDSLQGKTLGILGLGRIGEAIAYRAKPFGLKICYHNRRPKHSEYRYCKNILELAQESDILLCVLPGGAETRHIVSHEVLKQLGPNGYFINVGRGSSVDERALAECLSSNKIAGAALDVYEKEPEVTDLLLKQSNAVLLPHIGSATVQTRRAMGNLVIENLEAYYSNASLITEYHYQ